jgi:hypothetical protein
VKVINTLRDITVLSNTSDYKDNYMLIACDSIGSIGNKANDLLVVSPEISAKYCLRVCFNELYSVGAKPLIIVSNVSNEWDPTGKKIYASIKNECCTYNLHDIQINGSTEENFTTSMTAFSLTVIAKAEFLRWRMSEAGDFLYLVGKPYVGEDVLNNEDKLLKPNRIEELFNRFKIHDFIPCGSKGIKKEIEIIEKCSKTSFINFNTIHDTIFLKSAGPATCGIFTTSEKGIEEKDIVLLGRLEQGERLY